MKKCFYCSGNENHFNMNEVKIINNEGLTELIYFCDSDFNSLKFKNGNVIIDKNNIYKLA